MQDQLHRRQPDLRACKVTDIVENQPVRLNISADPTEAFYMHRLFYAKNTGCSRSFPGRGFLLYRARVRRKNQQA
jgi:hypothetical protein